jgi:hypothetical protein
MHDSTSQKIVPAQTFLLKIPPARNIENPECVLFLKEQAPVGKLLYFAGNLVQ